MVKFGRHLQFYLESDELQQSDGGYGDPFIVSYTDIRECIGQSQHQFVHEWTASLKRASDDYTKRVKMLWKRIFDDVFSSGADSMRRRQDRAAVSTVDGLAPDSDCGDTSFEEKHRGIPNDKVIQIYVSTMEEGRSRELFAYIKKLHSTAAMNCEALRKLVKKFDKGALARGDELLTSTLFPDLYSASFMAYPCLEGYIDILRDSLVVSEDEEEDIDEDSDIYPIGQNMLSSQKSINAEKRRAEELSWLHNTLASIPQILPSLGICRILSRFVTLQCVPFFLIISFMFLAI